MNKPLKPIIRTADETWILTYMSPTTQDDRVGYTRLSSIESFEIERSVIYLKSGRMVYTKADPERLVKIISGFSLRRD